MTPRTIVPAVQYDNKDISSDLLPYLRSLSYTDNMDGEADSLDITLEDREGLWSGDWLPEKGASLTAQLASQAWDGMLDPGQTLDLGKFEIDEISTKWSPSEVTIRAVSIPDNNKLRGEEHSRSWEKAKLSTIAKDLATGAGLTLDYTAPDDPVIDRAEQSDESGLVFLRRLCGDNGVAIKLYKDKLHLFDEVDYEKADAKITIVRPGTAYTPQDGMVYIDRILGAEIKDKVRDTYRACRVSYKDSKKKDPIEATFTDPNRKTGKTLQVHEQVSSIAEAGKLAKRRLREKNREGVTGTIDLFGDFRLLSTLTVQLLGFGAFDGKYLITSAQHSVGSGYGVSLEVRRCLDGY